MKHIYTLLLGLLAWSASMAQEGVNFRDITFEEALKQAKSENKLVFMDCYTSWCGPCKNMADKVFPQKAAGDYFNPRFVCVKYDMEKGAGVELAKKFEVHAYPTFLMIRPDGSVQHRLVGGDGLEAFIACTAVTKRVGCLKPNSSAIGKCWRRQARIPGRKKCTPNCWPC